MNASKLKPTVIEVSIFMVLPVVLALLGGWYQSWGIVLVAAILVGVDQVRKWLRHESGLLSLIIAAVLLALAITGVYFKNWTILLFAMLVVMPLRFFIDDNARRTKHKGHK